MATSSKAPTPPFSIAPVRINQNHLQNFQQLNRKIIELCMHSTLTTKLVIPQNTWIHAHWSNKYMGINIKCKSRPYLEWWWPLIWVKSINHILKLHLFTSSIIMSFNHLTKVCIQWLIDLKMTDTGMYRMR